MNVAGFARRSFWNDWIVSRNKYTNIWISCRVRFFVFKISQEPGGVRSSDWNHMLFGSYRVLRMQEIRWMSLVLRDHRSELNIISSFSRISGFATGFGRETHKKCGRLVFFESSTNRKLESWYRTASLFTWTRTWNITLEVIQSRFTQWNDSIWRSDRQGSEPSILYKPG